MDDRLLYINKDGSIEKKLYSVSPREKIFDEKWLQELLISHPHILPVKDIDSSWDNLIPLGREVSVTAGAIDDLYITEEGSICLVETKLWRNPEAHRTVVAQIIDYAKDLAKISFDEFKDIIEQSQLLGGKPKFWDRISKHIKDINQIEFQSKVQENLNQGRFLLLIVGDKIYPEVVMFTEAIQSAPNLEFKVGLVEIQMFKTSKEDPWPLLIMPKVVGKTYEVTRAVVRIVYQQEKPEIDVATIKDDGKRGGKTDEEKFKRSMQKEFADILIPVFEQWIDDGFIFSWGMVGFSVRFFWKGKVTSIIDVYPTYISLLTENMVRKCNFPLEPYHKYRDAINNIPIARRLLSENRRYAYFKDISLEEFKTLIDETDKLIRSFKKLEKIQADK